RITASGPSRRMYYFIRPLLGVGVRRYLQRIRLSGWDRIAFPQFPVDFSVESLMQSALALVLKYRSVSRVPFIWFWPDAAGGCAIIAHDVEGEAGRGFCGQLMDIDESHGLKSSFQIIPEARGYRSREVVDEVRSRGFEVNLHDFNHDGYLFQDRRKFLERVE